MSIRTELDDLDRRIVELLALDARTSNRRIAAELGVTEGTVRARIKRMQSQDQIRITAISNINKLRHASLVYIWIDIDRSDQVRRVARELAQVSELGFVGIMAGRADILAITMVQDNAQLADLLATKVSTVTGVRECRSSLGVRFVKHDYRISRIVGSGQIA